MYFGLFRLVIFSLELKLRLCGLAVSHCHTSLLTSTGRVHIYENKNSFLHRTTAQLKKTYLLKSRKG